jgi:glycine dehydrogenase subunit 2
MGKYLPRPFRTLVKHEFVLSGVPLKAKGVRTLDLAKRLLDEGVHAPTIYFPALVEESLMIELPETESKRELDGYIAAFERAVTDTPENLHAAPRNLAVGRIDEVLAAREPRLSWKDLRAHPAKVETPGPVPPAP